MNEATLLALYLVCALQAKHLIADFFLQGQYMIQNRRIYGHPGGLLHVAIHAAGTALVLLAFGPLAVGLLVWILIAEAMLHYHIDWTKDNLVRRKGWTPQDAPYWYATGVDQALHQVTYLGIAAIWLLGPGSAA